jgi:hypothetical protein
MKRPTGATIVPLALGLILSGLYAAWADQSPPLEPEWRVLWIFTQSFTTRDEKAARRSYAADVHNSRNWGSGVGNRLQKRVGGQWVNMATSQQPYDKEGPASAP